LKALQLNLTFCNIAGQIKLVVTAVFVRSYKKRTMKRLMLVFAFLSASLLLKAQEDEEESTGGFKKERLFTGGNVIASFYTGGTAFGLSPHFGYSITKWLDAALSVNFIYTSQRDEYGYKYHQIDVGPGAFIRLFPVNFLFVQAQYEHNFQSLKIIPPPGYGNSYNVKEDVNSLLLGAGFATGREGGNTYYYFSIMADVLELPNSPYVDSYGRLIPVVRAGFNIALFQGRKRDY